MTREEAIVILKNISWQMGSVEREQNIEAINMAIEALSAESNCKDCKKRNNTTFFMDDEEALDVDAREVHNCFEPISTPIYDYMIGKGGAE